MFEYINIEERIILVLFFTNFGANKMSYTKCISGNPYKTGSCVQGAMPTGVFTSGLTTDNFAPNVSKKDSDVLIAKFAKIDTASSGNNTIVAAVAGKKIRVLSYKLVCSGAVTVKFQSGAGGTDLEGGAAYGANGGVMASECEGGYFETAASTLLNLNLSSAVQVSGHVTYEEV